MFLFNVGLLTLMNIDFHNKYDNEIVKFIEDITTKYGISQNYT